MHVTAVLHYVRASLCTLSPGKLVDEAGFKFIWEPKDTPVLHNKFVTVYCNTHRDCKFLCSLLEDDDDDDDVVFEDRYVRERATAPTDDLGNPGGEVTSNLIISEHPVTPIPRPTAMRKTTRRKQTTCTLSTL